MRIETHAPVRSTAWGSIPIAFSGVDQSNVSAEPPHLLANGRESLATSLDAALLQKSMLELACRLFLSWAAESSIDTPLRESLFPALVDVAGCRPPRQERSLVESREQEQLAARLRAAFDAEPLEDGMDHPAGQIIDKALRSREDQQVLEWLKAHSLDAAHPSFAASVLRCLGRQTHPGTSSWRAGLVRDGLAMDDVEIRDAAVQAAELWGDLGLLDVLESHSEPVPWLRDYISGVIEDLGE